MNENNLEIENNSFNINPQLIKEPQVQTNVDNNNQNDIKGIGNNIIHPNKPGVDGYKVFIRQDGFPDFGNFVCFDDKVEFDPNKYKRPEIYFGFIHDQYLVPKILGLKNKDKKIIEEKKEDKQDKEWKQLDEKKNIKTKKSKKINTVKNLDDIMNKLNLKYIEPPKEEKIVEPPPEEENVEEEENPKDKNKKGKDTNIKGKNVKDDKSDKNKTANKSNKK